jgi:hypothetical protein
VAFTSYGNGGFDMLSRGLGMLGQDVQNYQQTQRLADLGQSIQGGNYKEAAQKAIAGGDLQTGLSLLKLGQANEPDPLWGKFFGSQTSADQPSTATADPSSFVTPLAPHFLAASNATGVDPRIIAGQAFLESAGGKSTPGNNLFGIKAADGSGVAAPTTEVVNGQPTQTTANFQAFASPEDSFKGYADFINSNPRYAPLKSAKTFDDQIAALGSSGYATDPNYAAKVRAVAQRIDPSVFQSATGQAPGSQVAASGNFLPRSLGPAPAAAGDDPPVTIPGFKGTWTRASAGATEADDSPEVSQVAAAQGKPTAAGATNTDMASLEGQRRLKEAGIAYYIGRKSIDPSAEGKAKALELELNNVNDQIKRQRDLTDAKPLTDPAERAKWGIAPTDKNVYFLKDGVPTSLAGQTINVDTRGENAQAAAAGGIVGKALVQPVADLASNAGPAHDKIVALNSLASAASDPNLYTGSWAEQKLKLNKALTGIGQAFGIEPSEATMSANSSGEMLGKFGRQLAGAQAKAVGGARTSNFELSQFMQANPNIEMTSQGIQRLTSIMQQMAQREHDLGNMAGDYLDSAGAKSNISEFRRHFVTDYDAAHPIIDPLNGNVLSKGAVSAKPPQQQQQQGPPQPVKTQQDYQALPLGTRYTAPDGSVRIKQ